MEELTERQAIYLAHAIHEIRRDWTVSSLMLLLARHRHVTCFGALVVAAATKAMDPGCRTPAPIFDPDAHWPKHVHGQLPAIVPCAGHEIAVGLGCRSCRADGSVGQ